MKILKEKKITIRYMVPETEKEKNEIKKIIREDIEEDKKFDPGEWRKVSRSDKEMP